MKKRFTVRLLSTSTALLTFSLVSCVSVGPPGMTATGGDSSSNADSAWGAYLYSSPFSYPFGSSPKTLEMLSDRMGQIPLDGVSPRIARHILESQRWADDYPSYIRRALDARDAEFTRVKQYKKPSMYFGKWLGKAATDRKSKDWERDVNGELGSLFGWFFNHMYAQSAGEAAAARVMAPLMERGRQLAREEFEIHRSLGTAPSNYLRSVMGQAR